MESKSNVEAPDGLSNHIRRLKSGDKDCVKVFIEAYKKRVIEIIIHDNLYKEFLDKLSQPECLAEQSLQIFADSVKKGLISEIYNPAKSLRDTIKRHINNSIHRLLKQACQGVYHKIKGAEYQLWQFEINVFIMIEKIGSTDFLFSDHTRVAKRVMIEFISQVKKNGTKDNKGKEIRDFPSYLFMIVKRRILDQKNRDHKWRQFPEFSNNNGSVENPCNTIRDARNENLLEDLVFKKEFLDILIDTIIPRLEFLERFIVVKYDFEGKNYREIRREMYLAFRMKLDESNIWRKHKKAKEKIRRLFYQMGIYNYIKDEDDSGAKNYQTSNWRK